MQETVQKPETDYQPEVQSFSYSNSNKSKNKTRKIFAAIILIALVLFLIAAGVIYINNNTINNSVKSVVTNTQNLNFTKLSNQADQTKLLAYTQKVAAKNVPLNNPEAKNELYGIFSGFDNNNIQLVTYSGIKNFSLAKNLEILKQATDTATDQATSSAITQGESLSINTIKKDVLFNKNQFGKTLQVIFSADSKYVQSIFLSE